MHRQSLVIAAVAALWAGGLAAQEPAPAPSPRPPRVARAPRAFAFSFSDSHGRIGVVVRTDASAESDKVGAKIEGVTPGSPAEKAGLKEGIVVVKAPADSPLPLKGGDVILSIGGRKPTSQSHAMRILRSYESGESVSIDILRKQKRMSLTWRVPEARAQRMRREQERHEREEQSTLRQLLRQQQEEARRLLRRVTRLQRV